MVQVGQIKNLEIYPLRTDVGERRNLLDDFFHQSRESVFSKFTDFTADSLGPTLDFSFVLAHTENLSRRQNDRFTTTTGMLTGLSNSFELRRRFRKTIEGHVELVGKARGQLWRAHLSSPADQHWRSRALDRLGSSRTVRELIVLPSK